MKKKIKKTHIDTCRFEPGGGTGPRRGGVVGWTRSELTVAARQPACIWNKLNVKIEIRFGNTYILKDE